MGYLELFGLIGLGTIVAMLCWGKLLDRGIATDRAREIFPDGPELDDGKNLAEICSPFKYETHNKKVNKENLSQDTQTLLKNNESQLNLGRQMESEVKLDEYLKRKNVNQKDNY